MSTDVQGHVAELESRWQTFKSENPKVRIRDAAKALGVSEAELVATGCGKGTTRLKPEWARLLPAIEAVGAVTVLTRNESCVHERNGLWRNVEVSPMHALVLDEGVDLRLFPRAWDSAFHLISDTPKGPRHSIQFFDRAGTAILKVFSREGSDLTAFSGIVAQFTHEDQSQSHAVGAPPTAEVEKPDAEIDVEGFRAAWRSLQDTHDFFPLLRKYGVTRTQALRLAEPEMAWETPTATFRTALNEVAQSGVPIMIFVGNHGSIQIHTGPVTKVQDVGPWFNVLDPDFNLHLKEGDVARAWLVRKPTVDGTVTALELFDANGVQILQMFGKRKPGIPEKLEWRETIERLAIKL